MTASDYQESEAVPLKKNIKKSEEKRLICPFGIEDNEKH